MATSALNLIREFEGYRESPYWDVNAHRAGYGSDTMTLPDGTVVPITPETRVDRAAAERDLERRVQTEFMPRAAQAIGHDMFASLSPEQQAALTSITYNYGSLPSGVVAASRTGDPAQIERAIRGLATHNDGINAARRNREADIFAGTAGIAGGPERVYQANSTETQGITPVQIQNVYDAYQSGAMSDPAMRAEYEAAIRDGSFQLPEGVEGLPGAAPQIGFTPEQIQNVYNAYMSGSMPRAQTEEYQAAIQAGTFPLPDGVTDFQILESTLPSADNDTTSSPQSTGSIAVEQAAPMLEGANQAWAGMMGRGPSPAGAMFGDTPENPPSWFGRNVTNRVADAGLAVLQGLGAGAAGAAGAVGDVAEAAGASRGYAERVGRDLAAMPDAFAASVAQAPRVSAAGARQAAARAANNVASAPAAVADAVRPLPAGSSSRLAARAERAAAGADVPPAMQAEEFASTVRSAAGGDARAAERVAGEAMIDPGAVAAAERLGVDLPADVMSNNPLLQSAAGLTRSVAGSPAEAAWITRIKDTASKATDAIRALTDNQDISTVSDNILSSLRGTQTGLKTQASALYSIVDDAVPPSTIINPNNSVQTLNSIMEELGGRAGMSAAESSLFRMVTDASQPNVTYARLLREKRAVQKAIRQGSGPYADVDVATLRRVESALVRDQLENVAEIGGPGLRQTLERANALTTTRKGMEDTIVSAFGRDGQGSIAGRMRTAIQGASGRGDVSGLNRTLEMIPADLRGQAVASSLANIARSARSADDMFGFAEFSKMYRGLQNNSSVNKIVTGALGPEATRVMEDLYEVSRRVTAARGNVLTTGKANQAIVNGMAAEGLVARILNSSMGKNATRAVASGAGAATAGPVGAGAAYTGAETLISALTVGKGQRLQQAGDLFASPEFQRLAVDMSIGRPTDATTRALTQNGAFRKWARANSIQNPEQWLKGAIVGANEMQREEPQNVE